MNPRNETLRLRRFALLQSKGEFSEIGGRDVRTITCKLLRLLEDNAVRQSAWDMDAKRRRA